MNTMQMHELSAPFTRNMGLSQRDRPVQDLAVRGSLPSRKVFIVYAQYAAERFLVYALVSRLIETCNMKR